MVRMVPALAQLVSKLPMSPGGGAERRPFGAGGDSARPIYHGFLRPAQTVRHRATWEGQMFRKLAILGLVLATYIVPTSSISQAKAYSYHSRYYPKGFYYRNGAWHPYRGYGHPYRGGYYDQWGHWHRYA